MRRIASLVFAVALIAPATFADTTAHVLSGGSFTQNWSNAGLITVNDNWSGVPAVEGYRGDDLTGGTGTDPQTIVAFSGVPAGAVLDVNANQASPNTFTTGGVAEFSIADPVVALQGSGTADAPFVIFYLDTTGRQGITVAYNLRDIDGSADNAVQAVALQYRVGNSGNFTNVPAGFVADASTGPSIATLVTAVSATLPAAADNQPLVQVRVITSNAGGTDEWIGIDDINITSSPTAPTLNINDVAAVEGAAGTQTFTFDVTLTAPAPPLGVTFDIATADNTATDADNDYEINSLTGQTIPSGSTGPYQFNVTVNGDNNAEPTETFFVNVTNISGANAGDTQGTGTIQSDDTPPDLTIDNVTQTETNAGTTTFTFTVSLSAPPGAPVVFDIATAPGTATAGSDYVHQSLTGQTINPGNTTYTFDVTVNGDTLFETNQTFFVDVTNVTGANVVDGQGLGTITNDDAQPSFSIADAAITEGNAGTSLLTFTVTLSAAPEATATVDYATVDGTADIATADYVAGSGTLSFVSGDLSELFSITINGDTGLEGDEHFLISLSNGIVATIPDPLAFGVIKNDEPISISAVNTPFAQDFDSLLPSVAPSTPAGWTFSETGSNANLVYTPGTGSGTAGDTYNFGINIGDTDRAFGGLQSGSAIPTVGALYRNDTGVTITSLAIVYFGEQWRIGNNGAARDDRLDFQYSLDATSLITGTWTNVDDLDFVNPIKTSSPNPAGALDGNAAANRRQVVYNITGLSIAAGDSFWIRFNDANASGSDDGLAVDDFSINANFSGAFLSIDDVTTFEGNAGATTYTFTVSLSQPAPPTGVTFDIATQDDTATTADSDYAAVTLVGETITSGNTSKQYNITVNGDVTVEASERFFVNVTNITNALPQDPQGIGTIIDDDTPITFIHDIQGNGTTSPIVGNSVTIRGIVTGVKSNGFFVQEEDPDATTEGNPATSEGIFVFTAGTPPAAAAFQAQVQVSGTVAEFVPSGDPQQPPLTELTAPSVVQLATGQPLPAAIPLTSTFPDPAGPFDQLERVEGMRVSAASITVTGPSDGSFNESAGTGTSNGRFHGAITGVARPFREAGIQQPDIPPTGTIPPIPRWDFNPERLRIESATINAQPILTVKSGDVVAPVAGPLDYAFRGYAIYPDGTNTVIVTPSTLPDTVTAPLANEVTVASFNLQRFFDDFNDPIGDPVLTTTAYDNRLAKASIAIRNHLLSPDIIGVQEAEKLGVLQDLAAKILADGGPGYDAYLTEGNDIGGIDVGFLVKTDLVTGGVPRVTVNSVVQEGAATQWLDPSDNAMHTLNDRPPLVLDAVVNRTSTIGFPVIVIVNHLRSLIGIDSNDPDGLTTEGDRVRQKRQAQAEFLANYVQGRLTSTPGEHIVVVGDFNAFEVNDGYTDVMNVLAGTPPPDNETVVPGDGVDLVNPDLVNLVATPPAAERYSYNHEGNAQNIDHALVSAGVVTDTSARRIEHPRIDSDYPETERNNNATAYRISDHDPVVAYLEVPSLLVSDFSIDLQPGYAFAEAGETMTFALVVGNGGPDAGDATVTYPLPAQLTFVSSGANTGWSCSTPTAGTNGTITCNTTTPLAASTFSTLQFTVLIDPATPADTSVSGTATVNGDNTDTNSGNDSDTDSTMVSQPSQYRATKTVAGTFLTGTNVTYTITIFNDKPFTQNDNGTDELTDVLPSSLTLVSANATSGTAVANVGTNTVTWNGSIASGGSVTITIVATIDADAAGTVSNQATIHHDLHNFGVNSRTSLSDDPGVGGTADPTNFTATQAGEVTATKSVSGTFVQGTNVTYTIVITNNMGIAQNDNFGHELTDVFPASLAPVSANATSGTAVIASGDTLLWNGSIPAGGTVTLTVVATINLTASGTISNFGYTHFDRDGDNLNESEHVTDDPSTVAVDDATSFTVLQANGVTATKSVSGTFVQGTNVTYTIVLTNNMTVTQNDNFQHEFTDVLPASLTPVSASATSGTAAIVTGDTVLWNGSIPSGGTVTITAVATINPAATGTISNQGRTHSDRDGDNQNETEHLTDDPSTVAVDDATAFNVVALNAYTATKSVAGTFVAGSNVTYTVALANGFAFTMDDNPGDEFTDVLPSSLTLVSATATSGTAVANVGTNTVTWNGPVAASGTVTITVVATISPSASGTISNQGTAQVDLDDDGTNDTPVLTDDTSTVAANDPTDFTVVSPAGLFTATKTASGTFVEGTNVTYSIVLANNMGITQPDNPGDELTDLLPTSLTLVSANATGGTAVANTGTNTVTWNGSIAASSSVTITITATINTGATGTVSNTANFAWDADGNATNEQSGASNEETFTIVSSSSYTATKSVTGTLVAGSNVTYTITLANGFAFTLADNAGDELTDVLPPSLTLLSASATGGTAVANIGTNTVTWNGSIGPSSSVTITIVATISPSASGTISNQATLAFDADNNGSNESAGTSNVSAFTVVPSTGLVTATKAASGTFVAGTTVTYSIVLTNNMGIAQADNAGDELADVLPSSLTLVSATATSGTAVANVGTNTVTWNGALASGASVTITITATINSGASGTVSNQAAFAFDADGNGTNEQSGTSNAEAFTVVLANAFSATKTVTGQFYPGGAVTYTITLTNGFSHTLADNPGDELVDVLPSSIVLVSATATSGTAVANTGTNTVTWNGSLAPSASVTITINGTIAASATSGLVSNQGTAHTDQDNDGTNETSVPTDDPGAAGSQATAFQLNAASDVTASKTVATTAVIGAPVTYTITITNNLPHTLTDNPGDEFVDVLPAELSLDSATATSGTTTIDIPTRTVHWNGSIPSGGSVTITINATIQAIGTISNQGEVFIDLDNDGNNETTIQTQAPGAGGPTVFAAAAALADIPSLSPSMLLALMAMLAALATWKMPR